jgi:acylphosphatase
MEADSLIRLNIRIIGNVQRVGYRHIVQNIARKHNITGSIENLEVYDVQIIAEGRPDDLDRFKAAIRICEYSINVESIESSEEQYTGEYSYFEVIRGSPDEELAERFDSAIAIFSRMEKKQDIALDMHKESLCLHKETLSLQKETISLQKKTLSLQEGTMELQRETLDEIKGTRSDLDKILSREISEMRQELREIRNALINIGVMHVAGS